MDEQLNNTTEQTNKQNRDKNEVGERTEERTEEMEVDDGIEMLLKDTWVALADADNEDDDSEDAAEWIVLQVRGVREEEGKRREQDEDMMN